MIKNIVSLHDKKIIPHSTWKFPAGEVGFRLTDLSTLENVRAVVIKSRLSCSDSILELAFAVNALREVRSDIIIGAHLPYLPYERQDRICSPGDSSSFNVFANFLEDLDLDLIFTMEPHSEKVEEMLPSSAKVLDSLEIIYNPIKNVFGDNTVFVAPDFGARSRVTYLADKFGVSEVYYAEKVREQSTGKITHLDLKGDLSDKNVIVFDDLLDGGKTFTELAKLFQQKNVKSSHLFVIHGIFSKGISEITKVYTSVTTTNSYRDFSDETLPENFQVVDVMEVEEL